MAIRLLFFFAFCIAIQAQTFVIRGGSVIDGTGTGPRRADIVVTRGKITAVQAPGSRIPKGARIVDASRKFIIPSLWDMHVHLWESESMFPLYVANGVLGLRDMGSDYARTRKWAAEAEKGIGPRVFTAGSPVDGNGTESTKMPVLRVSTPEEGRSAADTLDRQGVDFIKVMSTIPYDAYIALAQRARLRRAIFAGHLPESVSALQAVEARQRSMEHLFGISLACSSEEEVLRSRRAAAIANNDIAELSAVRERTYATFDERRCTQLFRKMAQFESWQVPTLTLLKRLALIDLDKLSTDKRIRLVPTKIRSTWSDPAASLKSASAEQIERFREGYRMQQKLVALMARNGVGLLAGTDTGDPYVLPGFALLDELEALVEAGLTPLQALQTATNNPARFLKIDDVTGSIQRGRSADLVILDGDPAIDIRNVRRINAVVVRGQVLNRKRLNDMLTTK